MPEEWVDIKHPKTKGKARVALCSFEGDNGLATRGWVLDKPKKKPDEKKEGGS